MSIERNIQFKSVPNIGSVVNIYLQSYAIQPDWALLTHIEYLTLSVTINTKGLSMSNLIWIMLYRNYKWNFINFWFSFDAISLWGITPYNAA